ncbi:MAG: hypothetical protein ACI8S6_001994 [Myxococcota bacterium]
MIQVKKPRAAPEILNRRSEDATGALVEAHERGEVLSFDRNIYAHPEVRGVLVKAQHGKCCYCEARVTHVTGDIEHFRPKASVRQSASAQRQVPGYFWCAYAWANLYLACSVCNTRKNDVFPLQNPAKRARTVSDRLGAERPTLPDPRLDPSGVITFDGPTVVPVQGRERGRLTIDCLDLNRPALEEHRRERQQLLRTLADVVRLFEGGDPEQMALLDAARAELAAAVEDSAEYAAMARVVLSDQPPKPSS